MAKRAVILVAGGTGTRMQTKTAKQFIPLCGKPVLFHTFEAFYRWDPNIYFVLVLFKGLESTWRQLCIEYNFRIAHTIVEGGVERFHSVKNGLDALPMDIELVGVHDAVRPLVSSETIIRCFDSAEKFGAAIPTVPVTDTIRQVRGKSSITLPRHELLAVQTPQCFARKVIDQAYNVEYTPIFTDDASVVEQAGQSITLVEGNRTNIKITTPEDLTIAAAFLSANP
jgi:2-C-methyl-D-erythritol 4-phosphate cytidylyltransferase